MAVGSMDRRIHHIGGVQLGPEAVLPIENILVGHVCIPWIPLTQAFGGESAARPTVSLPSTSLDEINSPQWSMVMEAFAELRNDMQKLKAE